MVIVIDNNLIEFPYPSDGQQQIALTSEFANLYKTKIYADDDKYLGLRKWKL
jgi:hypothetical protein